MVGDHAVVRGLVLNGSRSPVVSTSPMIVARTDKQFIPGLLKDLATSPGALINSLAQTHDSQGVLKLFQPVHRVFQIAVLQIDCDSFGAPRLDPAKIDSMGLVVRRVSTTSPGTFERWSKQGNTIAGWIPCVDDCLDPDPAHRKQTATTGNAAIDERLSIPTPAYAPFSESVAPLFAAPPQLCAQIKATVLYGLIPVTSVEKSEVIPPASYDPDFVQQHMPYFMQLSSSSVKSQSIIPTNAVLSYSFADNSYTTTDPAVDPGHVEDAISAFLNVLRQFKFELKIFDDLEAAPLFQKLNQFTLQDGNGNNLTDSDGNDISHLGDYLKYASAIIGPQNDVSIVTPAQWPEISDDQGKALAGLFKSLMENRLKDLTSGEARYEVQDPPRQYCLRAFVRVKRPDGCPPTLVWSKRSELFTIAPWYDGAGLPPIKITLPTLDAVKALKPNVAFAMPDTLFSVLQKDAKKTLKGEDSQGGGLGVSWICAFSIPIITICAFIVLNIFLSLFDLFFQWLLFIKICLPIPVPKKNP